MVHLLGTDQLWRHAERRSAVGQPDLYVLITNAVSEHIHRAAFVDLPEDAALATRDGLALTPGEAAAGRSGVGIGVLTLRVSVAAAPGTGVGSAVSSDEQPAAAVAATSARATTARRTRTQAV